ncbi:MAG: cytochrome c-type biogenesis protein CcmH [Nannocystaceae bacterium]
MRASPAADGSEAAEALTTELSHDLMSPYCPGRTIATCPSPQARKLEREIMAKAESGMTRQEIEAELVARFPDIQGYVGRPELIWGTALGAVLAIAALAWAARRWVMRGRASAAGAAAVAVGPEVTTPGARAASQREIDALEDALDEVDDF